MKRLVARIDMTNVRDVEQLIGVSLFSYRVTKSASEYLHDLHREGLIDLHLKMPLPKALGLIYKILYSDLTNETKERKLITLGCGVNPIRLDYV